MKKFTLNAIAAATMALSMPSAVLAEAAIGAQLAEFLPTMTGTETVMAVVTYNQLEPVSTTQLEHLSTLGISQAVQFASVPVIGVVANLEQIQAIANRSDVRSVWLNRHLEYFNADARQITGVASVQGDDFVKLNGVEYTGKGVTVMVNDSGIDATHQDLFFGDKVIDNVQGLTHASALSIGGVTEGFIIKNQPNTDTNSGHGTHCAGTIAGLGVMSDGKYTGAAPDAKLVGYGSGAVIAILDTIGAYDYAISKGDSYDEGPLRVMSNSWGSSGKFDSSGPVTLVSYKAHRLGILSVFAAGNSGSGEDTHNPYAQIPWGMSIGAGEKERGTLETLLISPIDRNKIVMGKFLTIAFAGTMTALLTVTSMVVWGLVLSQGMAIKFVADFMAQIAMHDFLLIFLMLVPVVAIFAAVLLSISIYAKSFKEAQSYMGPMSILVVVPIMLALLPGVELKGVWAWVPITNVSLALKELVKGTMDYYQLFAIFGSTVIIAGALCAFCVYWFNQEKVLFR